MTLTKRILSFLTAVIMLLSINVPFTMTASAASVLEEATELSDVSTQSWMSAIRGETRLSEITMPGTHDTGARDFEGGYALLSSISKCQGLTIPEQLDAGARFLDIRVEAHGESDDYYAFLTHGETTVRTPGTGAWGSISGSDKYYLDRLFKECYDFLDRHPSETILMCLKKDKGDQDIATSVYQYIHGVSKVNGNQYFNDIYPEGYNWQDHWYVAGDDPTLDDVRGKIVVFNRYNFDYDLDETTGGVQAGVKIDWNDQEDPSSWIDPCYELNKQGNGYIQDRYSWQKNDKLSATQQMLDLTHTKGMWYISFSSTTWGTLIPNPEGHANEINPGLPYLNFTPGKPSGIYLMDFLGASDSAEYSNAFDRKLIENNRAVSNLVTGTDGNIRYELNRLTKTLTISGNGAMSNYGIISGVGVNNTGTNAPWGDQIYNSLFDGQYNTDIIENIVIEDGVTAIGNYAFYGFDHIKNVSFPASLTTIGNNAFEGCSGLTSFDIRDDSITTIGNEAFKNCTGMTSFYTSDTVTAIGTDAFAGHSSSLIMYGPWECYSRDYADANNITYYGPYAVYSSSLNTVYENKNPFAGQDLSNGVKISIKQYCETDKGWDGAMLSFSSGKRNENRYFIIMANGAILFNDGSDGSGGTQCYFDINSNSTVNPIGDQWVDIDVTVSSASGAAEELAACGAGVASLAGIGEECGLILTMLPNGPQVKEVMLGENGVAGRMRPGGVFIDMSSIDPVVSREIAAALEEKGVEMLDAPVSGGEPKAIDGTLSFMVGGKQDVFDRCRPVLEAMGSSVIRCGGVGAGNTAKLANQIIVACNIRAVAEALTLAQKAGVDPRLVYEAIRGGLAGSAVLDAKGPMMMAGDDRPGFRIDLHIKDLNNALDCAHSVGAPVPMTASVKEVLEWLHAAGCGGSDHSAVARYYEHLADLRIGR